MRFDLENALRHETLSLITKCKKRIMMQKVQITPLNTRIHVKKRVLLENTALIKSTGNVHLGHNGTTVLSISSIMKISVTSFPLLHGWLITWQIEDINFIFILLYYSKINLHLQPIV